MFFQYLEENEEFDFFDFETSCHEHALMDAEIKIVFERTNV